MARFWVEFIDSGFVQSASTVDAPTPLEAAQKAANGRVTFRREEIEWIKVTPAMKSAAYEFVRTRQ